MPKQVTVPHPGGTTAFEVPDTVELAGMPIEAQVEVLTGDILLGARNSGARGRYQQILDPNGAPRNVDLPASSSAASQGLCYFIENVGAQDLNVRDGGGAAVLTIAAGEKALIALDPDGPSWEATAFTAASGGSVPVGVNRIRGATATSFATITDALATAIAGDAIIVGPGTYNESITIPAGVRVVGFPAAFSVILAGSDATSTRVAITGNATLREVTVVGPSAGANPAISVTNPPGPPSALFNVPIQGGGGTGDLISMTGGGTLLITLVLQTTGVHTGSLLAASAGTTAILGGGLQLAGGTCARMIDASGTAIIEGNNIEVLAAAIVTDVMIRAASSGSLSLNSVKQPDDVSNIANGLRIDADGVTVHLSDIDMNSAGLDLSAAGGLLGTGTDLRIASGRFTLERVAFPTGYTSVAEIAVDYFDAGEQNDRAYRFGTEVSVGSTLVPRESSFGEGDSSVNGMQVWTFDSSGAAWTDRTTEAKSATGSTFTMPGDVGDKIVIGHPGKFPNFNYNATVAAILAGGSTVSVQVWDGAGLVDIDYMASDAVSPYAQHAQTIFERAQRDQLRMSTDATVEDNAGVPQNTAWTDWTARDPGNGVSMFWVEITIGGANLTTPPTFQRFKIGNNRTEINADGFVEMYGAAEVQRALLLHQRLTDDLSGASRPTAP